MNLERPVTDRITIADQPDERDLSRFRDGGYAGVVNLRNDGEPEQPMDVEREGREAAALGLAYHHFGVGGTPLSDPGVAEACDFIDRESAKGKVLVHCRKGGRAAAIVLIQQARAHGWKADEAVARGRELGIILDPPLKEKVEAYLKTKA
ncbi:beta-lactamase hydrolase domain-containing protein [Planctomyces sp. SH-PL62]|uniref:beta-lactamase hydrolase domain-containing protein n=1 Tax=Planctomyces sp. SH-PL62 TaxID=1636152 RepID=UPI00078B4726|nr:sulfur transferase domain-containing protein [Planctomyces sp. SH-PL62]AMV37152.1 Beta-lactamase hydrolase-like protein [Planctomyces sp. SH-PL62]